MPARPTVVLGFIGQTLDQPTNAARWNRWRPSVAICQHEELLIDRFELIVQEEDELCEMVAADIASISPETELRVHALTFEDPWDFEEVFGVLHDFARAYPFNPDEEDYLIHITTGTHVIQICLFLLTESRHLPGRLLQSSPPKRWSMASPGAITTIDLDLSRYDRIAERFASEKRESLSFLKQGIETRNAGFNRLMEQVEHVALNSRAPLLLTGPTGAGKSHLARRVYQLKKARGGLAGRFVEVNCATLRGDTAMSTLFGHTKGAFTGALTDRPGLLRQAHGGMLFLDEIGELGVDEQAMLLRALEDKRFLPMGADTEVESDFQLISGTNRPLPEAVKSGRFRQDLLARINLWTFELPSLRERLEDIEPNLQFELDLFTGVNGRTVTFNKEARQRFLAFATGAGARWTGNFRDLNAAVSRMSTLAASGRITRDVVETEIERLQHDWRATADVDPVRDCLVKVLGEEATDALDRFDAVQLAEVVRVCQGAPNLSAAGRELFAASRARRSTTNDADRLRKYLAKFDLDWASVHGTGGG